MLKSNSVTMENGKTSNENIIVTKAFDKVAITIENNDFNAYARISILLKTNAANRLRNFILSKIFGEDDNYLIEDITSNRRVDNFPGKVYVHHITFEEEDFERKGAIVKYDTANFASDFVKIKVEVTDKVKLGLLYCHVEGRNVIDDQYVDMHMSIEETIRFCEYLESIA